MVLFFRASPQTFSNSMTLNISSCLGLKTIESSVAEQTTASEHLQPLPGYVRGIGKIAACHDMELKLQRCVLQRVLLRLRWAPAQGAWGNQNSPFGRPVLLGEETVEGFFFPGNPGT